MSFKFPLSSLLSRLSLRKAAAPKTSATIKEGFEFPAHIRLNLVSSLKFTNYMNQSAQQNSLKMSMEDLQALYSQNKQRIVLLYPFPAVALGPYSQDPIL